MIKTLLSVILLLSISISLQAQTPEELTELKCGSCHLVGKITKEKLKNMKAPPYWALAKKINMAYKTKEERVKFLVEYTLNPSEDKMLFPKETRKRFGVMPSQEGLIREEELKIISTYLFDDK